MSLRVWIKVITAGLIVYLSVVLYLAIASLLALVGLSALPLNGVGTTVILMLTVIGIVGIILTSRWRMAAGESKGSATQL